MFGKQEFEKAIEIRKKTKQEIADALEISLPTLYRKMNGVSDFFREEIFTICDFLGLSHEERESIFFKK